jgi:hypothetical protein
MTMTLPPIILLALLLAQPQIVVVDFPGVRQVEGHFHATLQVLENGEARGRLTLWHEKNPVEPGSGLLLTLVFDEAHVEATDGLLMIDFAGWGEVSDGRGRPLAGEEFTGQIGPWDPMADDDPIWQFHVGGVYSGARFEASTWMLLPNSEDRDPEDAPRR